MTVSVPVVILVSLAIIFDFLNGLNDSSNIVATVISSRAVSPRTALGITAVAEFCGPFVFGVAVAKTVGHDIVEASSITLGVVYTALLSAIIWNVLTWFLGIPSSSSHALVGGLIGAVGTASGLEALQFRGLSTVLLSLFISPVLGFSGGYLSMKLVLFLAKGAAPSINTLFKRLQIPTAIGLALSHGANDAPKAMGIITLGLVTAGYLPHFEVPLWVIMLCAGTIATGTAMGGWRLIRTLGGKFYKIRPIHGFSTQAVSAGVILGAALLGGPVSTSHVVSSAIMGVGSAQRLSKVRWSVASNIITAWLLTMPATAALAALFFLALRRIAPTF
jgi:PiT family inorganic phosphate transporter